MLRNMPLSLNSRCIISLKPQSYACLNRNKSPAIGPNRIYQNRQVAIPSKIDEKEYRNYGKKKSKITFGQYTLLLCPAVCFGLGIWQQRRKEWKLGLLDDLEKKTAFEPIILPHSLSDSELKEIEYRKVRVTGKFDHSKEMFIGPRSLIVDGGSLISSGIGPSNPTGYLVVTPFILSDRNEAILVNRGWVPQKKMNPENRKEGQIDQEITLDGIIRLTEKRAPFMPKETRLNGDNRKFYYRDINLMALLGDTSPIFIDATQQNSVKGGPIAGQTRVSLPNDHFTYMLTWYSLAAITLVLWYKRYVLKIV